MKINLSEKRNGQRKTWSFSNHLLWGGAVMLAELGAWFVRFLMPLVTLYHLIAGNVFLNTSAEDAKGLEKWGNIALAPLQYLLAAEKAIPTPDPSQPYRFEQRFDYRNHLFVKTAGSFIALPLSLVAGSVLKGAAYCTCAVRKRHCDLVQSRCHSPLLLRHDRYKSLGIDMSALGHPQKALSLSCKRHPGGENNLKKEKKALKMILDLLKARGILCWADCGTCLGAYRYGGVIPWDMDLDIAILQSDFADVKQALHALPRDKYLVQDWSNRLYPGTLLKVYVRKTREHIDIYHYATDPEKRTLRFILSHADNFLMPASWKIRESRFTIETPYDYVFPLKVAIFDGIQIPVPNQMEKYLQQRYGENLSPAKIYDPASNQYVKDLSHPYWQNAHVH